MTALNPRRRTRAIVLAATTAVAAAAALAISVPATAATGSTVSGTITYGTPGAAATPHSSVRLYALNADGRPSGGSYTASSTPADLGHATFTVGNVAPGRYRVYVGATDNDGGANAATWFGDTPFEDDASVVTVGAGSVTGVDVTQPVAGSISGSVTGATSVAGFQAWLYNPARGIFERVPGRATGTPGAYTISGLAAGKYVVRFAATGTINPPPAFATQYYDNTDILWQSKLVTITAGQAVTGIDGTVGSWGWYSGRMSGADRFATSAAVSKAMFDGGATAGTGPVVYVANGMTFADALGASAAAAYWGGPLLLTRPDQVPSSIVTELQRLKPSEIRVVGGTGAIGAAVYAQLAKYAPSIERVSGQDRYATSRAVIADAFQSINAGTFDPITSVFIATGSNFPDALVAGSAAGFQHGPLLLVNGSAGSLDATTKAMLASINPSRAYVVGGTGSVSRGIQNDLGTIGISEVVRLAGADRYGTAQKVNAEVFPFADSAFVASSMGFPDALSISAVAGSIGAPLLLAPAACIPYGEVRDSTALGVSTYWAVGGTGVLSNNITNLVYCAPGSYGYAQTQGGPAAQQAPSVSPADPAQLPQQRSAAKDALGTR